MSICVHLWFTSTRIRLGAAGLPKTRFAPQRQVGPRQSRKAKLLRPLGYGPVTLPSEKGANHRFDLKVPLLCSWAHGVGFNPWLTPSISFFVFVLAGSVQKAPHDALTALAKFRRLPVLLWSARARLNTTEAG